MQPMVFSKPVAIQPPLRQAITDAYRMDETKCLEHLIPHATLPPDKLQKIQTIAQDLVRKVRAERTGKSGLDAFLVQYSLSTQEGIALMCLAESLLRIPDKDTQDKLIKDKIIAANWAEHSGKSPSFWVNAATWGLMLTGKILTPAEKPGVTSSLKHFFERTGEPVIRQTILHAMKILGKQFVMGRTIEEALHRAADYEKAGYRFSYDMLGEAARTQLDADRYFTAYQESIEAIGKAAQGKGIYNGPGISIKLSALYPRYEFSHYDEVLLHVVPRVLNLAMAARAVNIGMTIDAEEADRLDLSLDIIERVFTDSVLEGWNGLGLAVQAYQKRAFFVLDWLIQLAQKQNKRLNVRLVKGAYWDTEVKSSQVFGLDGYPVFTRKGSTDVSYIACAKKMLEAHEWIYSQFATHNAYSVSAILEMAGGYRDFEFQALHGMGYTLYDHIVEKAGFNIPCRIYAPVGTHEDLLAYLVRRLLENGANTSFVNRILDDTAPIEDLVEDPVARIAKLTRKPHPRIPLPVDIYESDRKNSEGIDLTNYNRLRVLQKAMENATEPKRAAPLLDGKDYWDDSTQVTIHNPADHTMVVGYASLASRPLADVALKIASGAAERWALTPAAYRAACLEKCADLLQANMPKFMALAVREAGKTLPDAIAEVREAIDFCRYYGFSARKIFVPELLRGPTGESNSLSLQARGPMLCISPWNFPLAIFMGQITAALAAGNPVIAKPAEPTMLIAYEAVKLLHEAGIPQDVLQLFPAKGSMVGELLVADPRIKGVIFTGSTETAQLIAQTLSQRPGPIVPLIAETGGQNCMIVDSSALPEQVVADVLLSAFGSCGQRCSALRVLFLQEDIAEKIIHMLTGAMALLKVSDPAYLSTDIGPVIDVNARKTLETHVERMQKEAALLAKAKIDPVVAPKGSFFTPYAFEIQALSQLTREVFGPILHVIRYKASDLDKVIGDINATGYGLTFGIHTRIEETARYLASHIRAGNIYVNRSMIGAVVGVQPFGGEGLSGTGPKAGGPLYLQRLCTERTVSVNTTAAGGNASLLSIRED